MMKVVKSVLCLFLVGVLSISVAIPAMAEVKYDESKVKYRDDGTMYWSTNDADAVMPSLRLSFMDFDTVEEDAISVDLDKGLSKINVIPVYLNQLIYFKLEIPSAGKIKLNTEYKTHSADLFIFKDKKAVKFVYNPVKKELEFNAKSSGIYYLAYRNGNDINYLSLLPTFVPGDLTPLVEYGAPKELKIVKKSITLKAGKTYTLDTKATRKADFLEAGDSTNWRVANGDSKGVITAKKKGKATVTIETGYYPNNEKLKYSYRYIITVTVK